MSKINQATPVAPSGVPQFLKIGEVVALTRLSRASIYRLAANDDFPAPVKLSERASAWRFADVAVWIASRAPSNAAA